MVIIEQMAPTQASAAEVHITISGNQSATWSENKRYLKLQIGLSILFCMPLLGMGYWMILPFMLAVYLALIYLFWRVARKTALVEKLYITEDSVAFSPKQSARLGDDERQFNTRFPRLWVQLQLLGGTNKWYPMVLNMRAYGCVIQIGADLSDSEREQLYKRLNHYMSRELDFSTLENQTLTYTPKLEMNDLSASDFQ